MTGFVKPFRIAISRRNIFLSLLGIVAVGGGLRFFGLGNRSFWGDEINMARHAAAAPFQEMVNVRPSLTPSHLMSLPHYAMMKWFPGREWAARSGSAFFGVLLIFLVYGLGRSYFGDAVGLIAAGWCAIHPLGILLSRESKPYLFLACAFTAVLMVWKECDEAPGNLWRWALLFFLMVMVMFMHFVGVILIAALAGWMWIQSWSSRGQFWRFAVVMGVTGCMGVLWWVVKDHPSVAAVWVKAVEFQGAEVSTLPPPDTFFGHAAFRTLALMGLSWDPMPPDELAELGRPWSYAPWLLAGLVGLFLAGLAMGSREARQRAWLFALIVAVVTFVLFELYRILGDLYAVRRVTALLPLILLVMARGVVEIFRWRRQAGWIVGVGLLLGVGSSYAQLLDYHYDQDRQYQWRPAWRDGMAWLGRHLEPGEAVTFPDELGYYMARYYLGAVTGGGELRWTGWDITTNPAPWYLPLAHTGQPWKGGAVDVLVRYRALGELIKSGAWTWRGKNFWFVEANMYGQSSLEKRVFPPGVAVTVEAEFGGLRMRRILPPQ